MGSSRPKDSSCGRWLILVHMCLILIKYFGKSELNCNWAASWQNKKKWHVHPAKTQISLGICPDWSESSLSAWRKHWSLATLWAHSEDWSDWAHILLVLSCGGSNHNWIVTWQNLCEKQRCKQPLYPHSLVSFFVAITISVSSQCARGKSSLAWKPEVRPKFLMVKNLLKNVTLRILNFILIS